MKRKNIIMSILSLAILFTSNIKIVLAGDNGFGDIPKVQFLLPQQEEVYNDLDIPRSVFLSSNYTLLEDR